MQVTIPGAHRDRLIAAGYVREVLPRFVPLRALLHPKGKSPSDGAVSTASSH